MNNSTQTEQYHINSLVARLNVPKVKSMESPRTGAPVANQFIIYTDNGQFFQSYQSIIAYRDNDETIVLDKTYWDYSVTTLKYLKLFLGRSDSKKNIQYKIIDGTYKLADLN